MAAIFGILVGLFCMFVGAHIDRRHSLRGRAVMRSVIKRTARVDPDGVLESVTIITTVILNPKSHRAQRIYQDLVKQAQPGTIEQQQLNEQKQKIDDLYGR